MPLDVLLIHPNAVHGIYGPLGDELVAIEQPLWCRLNAGYLLDRDYRVKILDAEATRATPEDAALIVSIARPRLVGIAVYGHQPSGSSQAMMGARAFATEIKKQMPEQKIIMLGNHPSALPERTLREEPVDYVGDGEGPITLEGLLADLPLKNIPGLVWWDGDTVRCNPLAPLLDLDRDLHGDAWHLLPMQQYKSHAWQCFGDLSKRQPYAAIYTSLGCSYKCSFCMINVFQHTNRYRMRSPKAVVDEMRVLNRQYGIETFKFIDELFVLNKRHFREICQRLIDCGLGAKINSWCYSRTDTVTDEDLPLLRAAGFKWLALGIESGAKSVRDAANKSLKNDDIVKTVRKIQAHDINVISNFIFGLPTDDMESMQATLDLALELNTEFMNAYVCMAYPGSRLYEEAVEKGWTLPETWAGYSQHNEWSRPLDTEHVDAATVLRFRDEAFQAYFSSEKYQAMIRQKFGEETLEHVKRMLQYRLKRKLLEVA